MFKTLKGNGKVYTLQEASKITGLKSQTLRMRIKSGKLEAFKNPSKFGEAWLIKADNLKKVEKVDNDRLTVQEGSKLNGSELRGSIEGNPSSEKATIEAQREHIGTLQRTLQNFEGLLTTFQQRIVNLESEKAEIECKIRLLPAPIEEVASKLSDLEQKKQLLRDSQQIIRNLEDELLKERSRSWWQKLWGK